MTERRVWPLGLAVLVIVLLALLAWRWSAAEGGGSGEPVPAAEAGEAAAALPKFATDGDGAADVVRNALPQIAAAPDPTSAALAPVGGATNGSLLVRARWEADGTPVSGVGLRLVQWDRPSPLFHVVHGVTDESGEWLLRDLLPGKVMAYTDRSGSGTDDVLAGQLVEIELALPPGVRVRGSVVDFERRPVPGAGLWFCDDHGVEGPPATRADDGGRFELRGVEPGRNLCACASGFTASSMHELKSGSTEVELTIVLGPPGGALRGRIRSHDGVAIADAAILVGPEYGWPVRDPVDIGTVYGPPAIRLTSDAQGAFAVADIPVGRVPLAVRADGWPSWSSVVDVALGQTSEIEVELHPGGTVVGTVRDESGALVEGAEVSFGNYASMEWVRAESGADGRYELAGLRLGLLDLKARLRGGGRDKTQLEVGVGADNEWNPVLTLGLQIFGRVVDETGAPVGGLWVRASDQTLRWQGGDEADAEGRFTISNCAEGALTLIAQDIRSDPPIFSLAVLNDVRPGPGEVLLTVPSNRVPSAYLIGRFEHEDGSPVTGVELQLAPAGVEFGDPLVLDEQGAFRSAAKVAGTYRLVMGGPGYEVRIIEGLVLETGRTTDAGVIVVLTPGTLVLKPVFAADADPTKVQFWLRNAVLNRTELAKRRPDGTYWARLQAGDYELKVNGDLIASRAMEFTLAAGQTLELEVPVERGIPCTVRIELAYDHTLKPEVAARVVDPAGTVVLETTIRIPDSQKTKQRIAKTLTVPPGSYRFELRLGGEVALDEPMEVPDAGATGAQFDWRIP